MCASVSGVQSTTGCSQAPQSQQLLHRHCAVPRRSCVVAPQQQPLATPGPSCFYCSWPHLASCLPHTQSQQRAGTAPSARTPSTCFCVCSKQRSWSALTLLYTSSGTSAQREGAAGKLQAGLQQAESHAAAGCTSSAINPQPAGWLQLEPRDAPASRGGGPAAAAAVAAAAVAAVHAALSPASDSEREEALLRWPQPARW